MRQRKTLGLARISVISSGIFSIFTPSYFASTRVLSGAHFDRLVSFLLFPLLAQDLMLAKEGLGGNRAGPADLGWFR